MYQRYNPNRRPITRVAAVRAPSLLGQVLGITSAGFLITAAASYVSWGVSYGISWLALIAGFFLLISIRGIRPYRSRYPDANPGQLTRNPATSLALFYGFTALEGVGLAPLLHHYVSTIGPDVVVNAAATTGLGMGLLAAVVYTTSIDFRRMQGVAIISLLVLLVAGIISAFTHFLHPGTLDWCTLIVFTMLVLVDFTRIRAGGDGYTPVELAVQIYLDAINIFVALLQIFGLRSRED